jgi:hypothetical protein
MSKTIKSITMISAFAFALYGYAAAQGTLGDGGASGGSRECGAVGSQCRRIFQGGRRILAQ